MKINPVTAGNHNNLIYKKNTMINNCGYSPARVSSQVPENSVPQNFKELIPCYFPISFGKGKRTYSTENKKLAETPGNFKVCIINGIPCPACGKKMLSRKKYETITEELKQIPPDKYLDYLSNYKDYMRPVEESVFDELMELSKKPGASKDIRTLIVGLREEKLPVLQNAQMKQIKKMISLSKTLPLDEKIALTRKIERLKSEIHKKNAEAPFRRKIMLDRISKIKIRNPKKYQKLQLIAKNFPTSSDMNSAWIVKYSGKNKLQQDWDSYTIATRFLHSSVSNADHIIAYNLERNHDDISNYLAMHNACNSQKSNKTFLHWLNEDRDNRIKYLKSYFDIVGSLINDKKITKKKYRKYVAFATNTIFEASKGQVKIQDED